MVNLKKRIPFITGAVLFLLLSVVSVSQIQPFLKLTTRDYEEFSRVTIQPSFPLSFEIEKGSSFLLVKISIDIPFRIQKDPFDSRIIRSYGWTKGRDYYILTIKTKIRDFSYDYFVLDDPTQLVIDFSEADDESRRGDREDQSLLDSALSRESDQSSTQEIQTIVIDPGHGGMEPGAQGKYGTLEKDIALAIGLKFKAVIEKNFGTVFPEDSTKALNSSYSKSSSFFSSK